MKRINVSLLIAAVTMAALLIPAAGSAAGGNPMPVSALTTSEQIRALMADMNVRLETNGAEYRVDYAEYITADDSGEIGQIVFFNNLGNKQLGAHFVQGDPRRGGRTNITYIVDQAEGAIDGLTTEQTTTAIDRAMATWNGITCSTLPISKQPNISDVDLGVIEFLNGLGGSPFFFADITHAGWLPAGILPNNIIAVTFTFVFGDSTGLTDIDNNGKLDTAFREILYNDNFGWRVNGANIDVETVALHEVGHGLSQAHFGTLFQTLPNGKIHFSPRAVMNAGYTGVQRSIGETDNAGHCSIWGSWPNN
jgi:hypothetical protein